PLSTRGGGGEAPMQFSLRRGGSGRSGTEPIAPELLARLKEDGVAGDNSGIMLRRGQAGEVGSSASRAEVVGQLEYVAQMKRGKSLDFAEFQNQVKGQVDSLNVILENEGMAGLKQRVSNYSKALEREGRAFERTLGDAGEGKVWLHEPDMRVGGGPRDIARAGDSHINSVVGGQAARLARDIMSLPDDVTRIQPKITVRLPPRARTPKGER
ncbi:MAG TPA: hypothetical protein VGV38_21185, partial [Pyrinomonadaceae bacterium]|nr:hypothetical protein [Pyrinomonadaceae bacterium]